ncbi:acylneuraminate cytidylyltransferase [Anaerolineae bacterium CFX7]|nr:acylneuraminate cytidylyltransferase [Anaerolineae bacterium CFX7]
MNTFAIVQARMGSTRLPGKVLMDIGGASMLARVVSRTRRAERINQVVVATTSHSLDDAIIGECEHLGVATFRGSENDVLDRYYGAAKAFDANIIVRITSDCPLIDSMVIDSVLALYSASSCDYASNVQKRFFPRGLDTEAFSFAALERAWKNANETFQRVHVTPYIYQHPELFRLASLEADADYSTLRWTVDTAQDLDLVRAIYARLKNDDTFGWRDALAVVEREPELLRLNQDIQQKALHEG